MCSLRLLVSGKNDDQLTGRRKVPADLISLLTAQLSYLNSRSNYSYPGYNAGVDYVRKLRGLAGRELALKMYYDDARDNSENSSEQLNPGSSRFIQNENRAPNKQGTVQVDFTQPFKKGRKLEADVKTILRRSMPENKKRDLLIREVSFL